MKKYNSEEFEVEVLKRSGWTEKQLSDYLLKKAEKREFTFTDEDVDLFVKRLNNEI